MTCIYFLGGEIGRNWKISINLCHGLLRRIGPCWYNTCNLLFCLATIYVEKENLLFLGGRPRKAVEWIGQKCCGINKKKYKEWIQYFYHFLEFMDHEIKKIYRKTSTNDLLHVLNKEDLINLNLERIKCLISAND